HIIYKIDGLHHEFLATEEEYNDLEAIPREVIRQVTVRLNKPINGMGRYMPASINGYQLERVRTVTPRIAHKVHIKIALLDKHGPAESYLVRRTVDGFVGQAQKKDV